MSGGTYRCINCGTILDFQKPHFKDDCLAVLRDNKSDLTKRLEKTRADALEATSLVDAISELGHLACEGNYLMGIITENSENYWKVYLEFRDPSDEGVEMPPHSFYADTLASAVKQAIEFLKHGEEGSSDNE